MSPQLRATSQAVRARIEAAAETASWCEVIRIYWEPLTALQKLQPFAGVIACGWLLFQKPALTQTTGVQSSQQVLPLVLPLAREGRPECLLRAVGGRPVGARCVDESGPLSLGPSGFWLFADVHHDARVGVRGGVQLVGFPRCHAGQGGDDVVVDAGLQLLSGLPAQGGRRGWRDQELALRGGRPKVPVLGAVRVW